MTPTFRRYIGSDLPSAQIPTGHETGDAFGRLLYSLAMSEVCARIDAERRANRDSIMAGNFGPILEIAATFVPEIAKHQVANAVRVDLNGLAWWLSARRAYAEEVAKLIGEVTAEHIAALPSTSNLTMPTAEEIAELVDAFLYPDMETCRRSEDWKRERLEMFDAIRSTRREACGWDSDL